MSEEVDLVKEDKEAAECMLYFMYQGTYDEVSVCSLCNGDQSRETPEDFGDLERPEEGPNKRVKLSEDETQVRSPSSATTPNGNKHMTLLLETKVWI